MGMLILGGSLREELVGRDKYIVVHWLVIPLLLAQMMWMIYVVLGRWLLYD